MPRYFPRSQHDDGLDALEMAVRAAEEGPRELRFSVVEGDSDVNWIRDYRRNFGWNL